MFSKKEGRSSYSVYSRGLANYVPWSPHIMKRRGTKVENSLTAAGRGNSYTGAGEQAWQGHPSGRRDLVG